MRWRRGVTLVLATIGGLTAGCRELPRVPERAPPPTLETVPRTLATPDVSQLKDENAGPTIGATETYRRLTAGQCCSFACTHSAAAHVIEVTAASDPPPRFRLSPEAESDRLRKVIAGHLAHEARLQTSALALDLYYQLLEAELLADVLRQSQAEVDRLVAAGRAAAKAGVRETEELLALRKRQIELRTDRSRLQSGIDRLNIELKALVAIPDAAGRLLPVDAIQVVPDPLDEAASVRIGLGKRPDLWLVRDMIAGLNARTLSAVQQAVADLVPALKAITTTTQVLTPGLRSLLVAFQQADVAASRRQLVAVLEQREENATKEIRAAVRDWTGQRELAAIAKQRVEFAADRVRELEARRAAGAAVEGEYRQAILDRLAADADLIRASIKWKQADVKVRQTMGLLCGDDAGVCR